MKILLIEDEKNIISLLKEALEKEGYQLSVAYDGETGVALAQEQSFDVIFLDIILPKMNGWDVCKKLRQGSNQGAHIIMLTALSSTENVVKGLDSGADDYLSKPFKVKELIARLNALKRRQNRKNNYSGLLEFADLQMNLNTMEVRRRSEKLKLTAREFKLLKIFMENPEQVLSRDEILDKVWGVDFDTGTNIVDVYISFLRNKIENGFDSRVIHTVVGAGYILKE